MQIVTHCPAAPLGEFVELIWISHQAPAHAKERLLPGATMELVISLQSDRETPLLCGPQSEHFEIETAGQAALIGVHFKPGGAFPFLDLPACELHNAIISLEALWGRRADELHEQLLLARTPVARFRLVESALLARLASAPARHPAVAMALQEFGDVPQPRAVSNVTERIGISARRFIELFRNEVGVTPKLYCRILRFQEVVRHVHGSDRVDWAEVALDCGYYDQSHLIRDFQEFAGLSPTAYLHARGEHLFHVPIGK